MAIADSTLITDVWTEIKSALVAAAPYVTNTTTSATTAATINAAYNDKTPSRPQIVIYGMDMSEDNWRFGGTEGKKLINVPVECYHKTSRGVDEMSNQIMVALKENSIDGIDLVGVTVDTAFDIANSNKYHLKTLMFSYDRE